MWIYKQLTLFKKQYQRTFVSWTNEIRLEEAYQFLKRRKANYNPFKFLFLDPKLVI